MVYDSLLLNNGGGIISSQNQSKQYAGAASLCIGIGGTGIAALSALKRKVYQQLLPDNPGDPIPRYKHIQFLAIDSDESAISSEVNSLGLVGNEFFSIHNPKLAAMFTQAGKDHIKTDPTLNWMEIDKIDSLLSPQGAGGVRQVGRYLLMKKAGALKDKIHSLCTLALEGLEGASLDIYIFAGISGGTGSGCFIDTCYIAREAIKSTGIGDQANLFGFFFLPDVVTSKKEIREKAAYREFNNSNGYAAMKELDYYMHLKDADDWFKQNYGAFNISTQNAPVNMCHLVSATKANGDIVENAFGYAINVASDYVMAYLSDVDLQGVTAGADDQGMTMRGHLSNVTTLVSRLQRKHGANLSYHVLGASNAEIPMTQIATYLAAGYYHRFQKLVGRLSNNGTDSIPKKEVNDWVKTMGIEEYALTGKIDQGKKMLSLPDVTIAIMKKAPLPTKGSMPEVWNAPGQSWVDESKGTRARNIAALNGNIDESWLPKNVATSSLIGAVFQQLCSLCMEPEYGPYYAAKLLKNEEYDLRAAVKGIITTLAERKSTEEDQLTGNQYAKGLIDGVIQAATTFKTGGFFANDRRNYQAYKDITERYFRTYDHVQALTDMIEMLKKFDQALLDLYNDYFRPLIDILDNLKQTFEANDAFLNSPAATKTNAYTTRILDLKNVQKTLDSRLAAMTPRQLVTDMLEEFIQNPSSWMNGEEQDISELVRKYMTSEFSAEISRSLEDYLYELYPHAKGNPTKLADEVEKNIINPSFNRATPMFWCDPTYSIDDTTVAQTGSLSLPSAATAVCNAGDNFWQKETSVVIRKVGLQDRIFALRFFSGLPFHAYQGVTKLKSDYDKAAGTAAGAGAHLYAHTGRGSDGSGSVDARHFIPTPMPYSVRKSYATKEELAKDDALLAMYDKAEDEGVIQHRLSAQEIVGAESNNTTQTEEYLILETKDINVPSYEREDFVVDEVFQVRKLEAEIELWKESLESLRSIDNAVRSVTLKNDGSINLGKELVDTVRKDYFLHYPKLHSLVQKELDKRAQIKALIQNLESLQADHSQYDKDIKDFSNLVFYGNLECLASDKTLEYDNLRWIQYPYEKDGEAKVEVLSQVGGGYDYGEKYPLYQAFLSYRKLDPEKLPRREMHKFLEKRVLDVHGEQDRVIADTLAGLWTPDALADLNRQVSASMKDKVYEDMMRFYRGFAKQISEYLGQFKKTSGKKDVQPQPSPDPTPPPPPPQPVQYWVTNGSGVWLCIWSHLPTDVYDQNNNLVERLTPQWDGQKYVMRDGRSWQICYDITTGASKELTWDASLHVIP